MRLRGLRKGALLVTASSLLIALVTLVGLFSFIYHNADGGRAWSTPMERVSAALTWDGTAYTFTGEGLLKADRWGMLLDQEGRVVWSIRKPEELPEQYTLTDVAAFTRWYLNDYPVQSWVREDGLLRHLLALEGPQEQSYGQQLSLFDPPAPSLRRAL